MKVTDCTKIMAKDAYAEYKVRKVVNNYGTWLYPKPEYPSPYFIPQAFYDGRGLQNIGSTFVGLFVSGVPAGTTFSLTCDTNDCEGEGGYHGNRYGWIGVNTGMSCTYQTNSNYINFTANTDFTGWICYGDDMDFSLTGVGSLSPNIKGIYIKGYDGGCGGNVGVTCWNELGGVEFLCCNNESFYAVRAGLSVLTGIKYFIPLYGACYGKTYDLSDQVNMTTETFYYTARDAHNISLKLSNGVDGYRYYGLLTENNITIIN